MPEKSKIGRLQPQYSDWSIAEQLALVEAVQRYNFMFHFVNLNHKSYGMYNKFNFL